MRESYISTQTGNKVTVTYFDGELFSAHWDRPMGARDELEIAVLADRGVAAAKFVLRKARERESAA